MWDLRPAGRQVSAMGPALAKDGLRCSTIIGSFLINKLIKIFRTINIYYLYFIKSHVMFIVYIRSGIKKVHMRRYKVRLFFSLASSVPVRVKPF